MRCWLLSSFLIVQALLKPAGAAELVHASFDEKQRTFLSAYCVKCHNETKQKGKLRLDDISFRIDSIESADRWQKILNRINSGEMPPDDAMQPEPLAKTEFLASLSHAMVGARRALSDVGGKIVMRRLNRREYKNTIRDLLGVDVNVHELPPDGGAGTFDTVGSSLFVSSDQLETYLTLARASLDESFSRYAPAKIAAPGKSYKTHLEPAAQALKGVRGGLARMVEAKGRYQKWAAAVDVAAALPENVDLAKQLRAMPSVKFNEPYFYVQWGLRRPQPSPKDFGFHDSLYADSERAGWENGHRDYEDYLALPNTDAGAYLTYHLGPTAQYARVERNGPIGKYMIRMRIAAADDAPAERRFIEVGHHGSGGTNGIFDVLSTHEVTGTMSAPQIMEIPVDVSTTTDRAFVIREKKPKGILEEAAVWFDHMHKYGAGQKPVLRIDWIDVDGPLPDSTPPAVDEIESALTAARNHGQPDVPSVLEHFAARAFRDNAPGTQYLDKLVKLYEARIQAGEPFEQAIKEPLSVVLASPHFLYLDEPAKEGARRALSGNELAARLSYFLWSAPPDETLLKLARNDEILKPQVLGAQVARMIDDEKFNDFSVSFTNQWLGMDRLDFFQFNTRIFPEFDESAKAAARKEVFQTIEYLLRTNDSLPHLLKSDYVVVNGLLANYYGIDGVKGDEFRKVAVPAGSPRGGLLGMAAILAMGTNGEKTSPVERGAWVLRRLLHDPPPPAPPNVPQISRLDGKLLTTRERLLAHQEQPQCASCHRVIDPIGFGLENFNTVGKWRTEDSYETSNHKKKTWSIDPAGAFHNGPAFKDFFELRDLIAAKPERLARDFTEALIEYGLGRPCGFSDDILVDNIVQHAQKSGFGMREFILALVESKEFQSK